MALDQQEKVMIEKIQEMVAWFAVVFFVCVGLFSLYAMFVYTPVSIYTEAECLRKGYPKHAVSVGLERYCMNLDGSVTVKVDHQGDRNGIRK